MIKPYYKNQSVTLYHGDCFDILPTFAPGSFDAAITDPPYGCTECGWDCVIGCASLHAMLRAACKCNAAKVYFSNMRFAARLIAADEKAFRYDLCYFKANSTGYLNAMRQPLRSHENILVFYDAQPTYNPQMWQSVPYSKPARSSNSECYAEETKSQPVRMNTERFPLSVLYNRYNTTARKLEGAFGNHPTQKPVATYEYLIRTYTNEAESIIDPFAGSGTAGVAAMRTGRRAVLIELEEKYCELTAKRLEKEATA